MKSRRLPGSIHYRGKNRDGEDTWQVSVPLKRERGEKPKSLWKRIVGTEADAITAHDKLAKIRNSRHALSSKETVKAYLMRWLESTTEREDIRASTAARYRQILELHVIPTLGAFTLKEIEDEPERIQRLYRQITKAGNQRRPGEALSGRSVLHVHRVLFTALDQAKIWRLIETNPCDRVRAPKAKRVEMRTLSSHEVRNLIAASVDTRLHAAVVLTAAIGTRRGETLGLKWSDVDFEAGTVRIHRSLQPDGTIVEPKTARSRRTVAVPTFALDVLRKHRTEQVKRRVASGPGYHDTGFIFTDVNGEPWKPASIATLFRSIARRADLGHLRFHDLRHTAASLMIERGVPVTTVAATLGHANTATTLGIYAHAVKGSEDVAARAMDDVFKGVANAR